MQITASARLLRAFSFAIFSLSCGTALNAAATWPQFRGAHAGGISESDKPPVEFGSTNNFLWKTLLPTGWSSPCIWEDRIFLTGFMPNDKKLRTVCVRRSDGELLWRQFVPAEEIEEVNPTSSPASATPVTDGKAVFSYFGSFGLLAYDFDGKELWRKPLPLVVSLNGSGTSPVLVDGLVIVNRDQEEGKSSLLAVDARTGKTVWETPRAKFLSSYATPVVWERGPEKDIVLAGSLRVVGYAAKDGKERWSASGLEAISVCPTPVIGDGRLYVASRSMGGMKLPGFEAQAKEMDKDGDGKIAFEEASGMLGAEAVFNAIDENKDGFVVAAEWDASAAMMSKGDFGIFALRAPGAATGDITDTHVTWKARRGVATVPSPLFYRGRVYLVQDGGRMTCCDAKTGKALYEQERLNADGEYWASPIAADGKIYVASSKGVVTVIEAGETLKVLAQNKLGERIAATPAIADDKLYVRTQRGLWAFGKSAGK